MALIQNINPPEQGLIYSAEDVRLKIGSKLINSGLLYITEDYLSWRPCDNNEGISLPWKNISLHAISENPTRCIYVMLDLSLRWEGVYDPQAEAAVARQGAPHANGNAANNNDDAMDQNDDEDDDGDFNDIDNERDEGNESDCDQDMTEIWLVPSNSNAVDMIFQAMKQCQALHPDSADSISDESDFMDAGDGHDEDEDDEVGQGDMRNLNINEDRFADAEET